MERVDNLTPELAKLFAGKEQRRHELARMSYPEKVQAVMQLQEMAATILRSRGKIVQRWSATEPVRVPGTFPYRTKGS